MAAAEHQLLDADYDDYADSSASGAAFCRSAALIEAAALAAAEVAFLVQAGQHRGLHVTIAPTPVQQQSL